jgi:hypothetical protein
VTATQWSDWARRLEAYGFPIILVRAGAALCGLDLGKQPETGEEWRSRYLDFEILFEDEGRQEKGRRQDSVGEVEIRGRSSAYWLLEIHCIRGIT